MPQGDAEEVIPLKAGACAATPKESTPRSQSEASANEESAQRRETGTTSSGEKLGVELPDRIEIFAPCGGGTTQGAQDNAGLLSPGQGRRDPGRDSATPLLADTDSVKATDTDLEALSSHPAALVEAAAGAGAGGIQEDLAEVQPPGADLLDGSDATSSVSTSDGCSDATAREEYHCGTRLLTPDGKRVTGRCLAYEDSRGGTLAMNFFSKSLHYSDANLSYRHRKRYRDIWLCEVS